VDANKPLSEYNQSDVALAKTVFGQIQTIYERQYSFEPRPDTVLYHYTSAEGLKGIIENNELWATSAYYLNDSAEMFYGYGVLREVLSTGPGRKATGDGGKNLQGFR